MTTTIGLAMAILAGPFLRPLDTPSEPPRGLQEFVTTGVERVVSRVLGAPTKVGAFQWDPEKQRLDLMDVHVGNPEGFQEGDAIVIKKLSVESDPRSLMSDQPEIRVVDVGSVTVNALTALGKGNNLKKLMDNAKKVQPKVGGRLREQLQAEAMQKRWKIDQAVLEKSTVNISTPLLSAEPQSHEFGPVEMSFKGENGAGMTANEILGQVMERLLKEINLGGGAESPLGGILDQILTPGSN